LGTGAFDGRLVEIGRGRGHGVETGRLGAASALTEDHHVVWIASEGLDVLVDPLERVANVEHPLVAGRGVFLTAKVAQVEIAHQPETMVAGHDNDIPSTCEVSAVLVSRSARSGGEATTVAVEHHGPLASISRRRPDVEEQTVFGGRRFASGRWPARLRGRSGKLQRVPDTSPRRDRRRRLEAVRTGSGAGIRNALEGRETTATRSANAPARRLDLGEPRSTGLCQRQPAKGGEARHGHRAVNQQGASSDVCRMPIEQ
jgi:hypothetical protein